jgi:phosphocarrier protein HPr
MTDGAGGRAGAAAEATSVVGRTLLIKNQRGLHARAAARFVKCAEQFDAEVKVAKKDAVVSGLSIMGLMMLAAGPGTMIEVTATGAEAQQAIDALAALVDDKFGEDE